MTFYRLSLLITQSVDFLPFLIRTRIKVTTKFTMLIVKIYNSSINCKKTLTLPANSSLIHFMYCLKSHLYGQNAFIKKQFEFTFFVTALSFWPMQTEGVFWKQSKIAYKTRLRNFRQSCLLKRHMSGFLFKKWPHTRNTSQPAHHNALQEGERSSWCFRWYRDCFCF